MKIQFYLFEKRGVVLNDIEIIEGEQFIELELSVDGIIVGEAAICLTKGVLSKLYIYEPFQNVGYGTRFVQQLTKKFNLKSLNVRANNVKAIHVYEKCGYVLTEPEVYTMEYKGKE